MMRNFIEHYFPFYQYYVKLSYLLNTLVIVLTFYFFKIRNQTDLDHFVAEQKTDSILDNNDNYYLFVNSFWVAELGKNFFRNSNKHHL